MPVTRPNIPYPLGWASPRLGKGQDQQHKGSWPPTGGSIQPPTAQRSEGALPEQGGVGPAAPERPLQRQWQGGQDPVTTSDLPNLHRTASSPVSLCPQTCPSSRGVSLGMGWGGLEKPAH